MSIEEIIRAWKAENPDHSKQSLPEVPVGDELSTEELEKVLGGQDGQEKWYAAHDQTYGRVACSSARGPHCK